VRGALSSERPYRDLRVFWRLREPAHILIRFDAALWRGANSQIHGERFWLPRVFPLSRGVWAGTKSLLKRGA
jgi:hypothetical protein